MNFKRLLYFLYYLKEVNWVVLKKFMYYTERVENVSKMKQAWLILENSLKYNISILEFYQFGFLNKSREEKEKWAGTGTMYELQLKDNPLRERKILDDKRLFLEKYRDFVVHTVYTFEELEKNTTLLEDFLKNNKKIVFKEASGKCGAGVSVQNSENFSTSRMLEFMKRRKFDMVESFIEQHPDINKLSPSAVNTVRIFTRINDKGEFTILGCRMRISVNCEVDNLAAGNLAAPIDEETGVINGPAVYSDITKSPEIIHPATGIPIIGFQVPYWNEILAMVKKASWLHSQNKSIGWDVVVTKNGPGLIEGNHDWCKLVWQLPVHRGLKHMLN